MTSFKDRLKKIAALNSMSISAFERKTGLSNGYVNNLKGSPSLDKVEKIILEFPHISREWLLFGEGPIETQDQPTPKPVPFVPANALAGAFPGATDISTNEYEWNKVLPFSHADFLIPVKGDSMLPKYQNGDILACKIVPVKDTFFQWGKPYVIDTIQGALVKIIRKGSTEDTILLVSENPQYEPFEIHLEDVYHIATILGSVRTE